MNGYETKKVNLECKINGWYWGNLLIGGVLGMLIIDPATGAMYKLDSDFVDVSLEASKSTTKAEPVLKILDKNDIPAGLKTHLVEIK